MESDRDAKSSKFKQYDELQTPLCREERSNKIVKRTNDSKKYDTTGKNNAVSRAVNTAITEKNTRLIDRKDAPF